MRRKYAFVPIWVLSILTLCLSLPGLLAEDVKLKVEDIVARHLASIGTPEARAAVQSRVVSGTVRMVPHLHGGGQLSGKINILSEGRKLRYEMNFVALDYPGAQLSFDGEKIFVGQVRPGEHSTLSEFVYDNEVILKEGLLGGTLSTAWPLLDLTVRQAKLSYTGLKRIEGKQLHEVQYWAKKGGKDIQVYHYFDPESFRHVRTQYRLAQSAGVPAIIYGAPAPVGPVQIGETTSYGETICTLTEQFDNFKRVNGLMLPQMYMLKFIWQRLNFRERSGTVMLEWNATLSQIAHNHQINPKFFTIK
jgi:hypothetical protein